MSKHIQIAGAGLSGMVAAVHLARQGFAVRVFDTAEGVGAQGPHPSCHATPLSDEFLWPHLGIALDQCFRRARSWAVYVGHRRIERALRDFAVVERGSRPTSVDWHLFKLAREAGVQFEFSCHPSAVAAMPAGAIVATGLNPASFRLLGIPCEAVSGYWARTDAAAEDEDTGATWFGPFTRDYAYACCTNGLRYFMVLARGSQEPDLRGWRAVKASAVRACPMAQDWCWRSALEAQPTHRFTR